MSSLSFFHPILDGTSADFKIDFFLRRDLRFRSCIERGFVQKAPVSSVRILTWT